MPGGYAGRILFADLTTGTIKKEAPSDSVYRDFIGGTGLGIRMLYEHMKPKADPLGPENVLGFVTGPLTATPTPGSGRFTVVTKSPLTGAWADANAGGFWGPELKWAGYDGVFISGASPKPVYLFISGDKAEIRDASHLWGKDANETDDILQRELGRPQARVACIGPAGEACSLISGIVNERGRIAARSGVGAVMGSKRLKAVVVRGDKKKIAVAEPEKLKSVREVFTKKLKNSQFHQGLTAAGTGGGTSFLLSIGDCPTKNWNATGTESMPTAANLDSANMDKYKLKSYGCHTCPVRCGAIIQAKEGPFATNGEVHRPEYETLAALGTLCLNDSVESVIRANEICNLYGLDTMAVGNVIAFAMECYENGLIDKRDSDGIELTWGNAEAVVSLAEKIAKREGFGAVLADGVEKAAERIGKGAEKYAIHVHGHRLPYHDPRNSPSKGTIYMADAQPAAHMDTEGTALLEQGIALGSDPLLQPIKLEAYGDYGSKGPMYATGAAYYQLLSSAGLCSLYTVAFAVPVVELIAPVTGWDFSWEEGLKAGRRILTLRQAFNSREGLSPAEFKLPERVTVPQAVGPAAGAKVNFNALKKGYFEAMGWDIKSGKPYRQTLIEMGLDQLASDL
jgi:aldehyde:ferredoxin oxidoreductase